MAKKGHKIKQECRRIISKMGYKRRIINDYFTAMLNHPDKCIFYTNCIKEYEEEIKELQLVIHELKTNGCSSNCYALSWNFPYTKSQYHKYHY